MIVLILAGISITIALGFLTLYINDWYNSKKVQPNYQENVLGQMEPFCQIDMDRMLIQHNQTAVNNVPELRRKIQEFKDRNRFYTM